MEGGSEVDGVAVPWAPVVLGAEGASGGSL